METHRVRMTFNQEGLFNKETPVGHVLEVLTKKETPMQYFKITFCASYRWSVDIESLQKIEEKDLGAKLDEVFLDLVKLNPASSSKQLLQAIRVAPLAAETTATDYTDNIFLAQVEKVRKAAQLLADAEKVLSHLNTAADPRLANSPCVVYDTVLKRFRIEYAGKGYTIVRHDPIKPEVPLTIVTK